MTEAKQYQKIKLTLSIAEMLLMLAVLFFSIPTGISKQIYQLIMPISTDQYIRFLGYSLFFGMFLGIVFSPFSFYTGYILEHKYHLSNQSFKQWLIEGIKGMIVSLVIGAPLLLIFYFLLNAASDFWWIWFSFVLIFFSIVLAQIFPVLIFPIFYKQSPVVNDVLVEKVGKLAAACGLRMRSIAQFNMSKNTKKANAMLAGFGRTKRILLGDTLIENYSVEEIESVVAHEMGHYHHRHIIKNIFIGSAFNFITFFLIAVSFKWMLSIFHFNLITEIPAFPLLIFNSMIIGFLQSPLHSVISRSFEYQADAFSVKIIGSGISFITALEKINNQNLGDADPHPFIEWFFYSHPSIKNRISAIRTHTNEK
jgi:STE24 endopeptidase